MCTCVCYTQILLKTLTFSRWDQFVDYKGQSHGVKGQRQCGMKQDWKEQEKAFLRNEMEMCSECRSGLRFQAGYGALVGHFSQVHKAKIRDR